MLLLPCFPRYKPGVPLTEVSQLPKEAAIGLVLTVQLGRVFGMEREHLQLSMPKEWLLKEMREQTQQEQLIRILT